MQQRIGMAVKSILIQPGAQRLERSLEVYLVSYIGTSACLAGGSPLVVATKVVSGIRKGERLEFDGLGLLAVEPVEFGEVGAWCVELWESDSGHRAAADSVQRFAKSVGSDHALAKILSAVDPRAWTAQQMVELVAEISASALRENGDDLVASWSGSLLREDIWKMPATRCITRNTSKATVEFTLFKTGT